MPPSNAEDTFATILVPEHKPLSSFEDTGSVLPPATRALFKNKTVIVGAEFVDRDLHLTPLSVADKRPFPASPYKLKSWLKSGIDGL